MVTVLRLFLLGMIVLSIGACTSSTSNTPDGYYMTAKLGGEDFSAMESSCSGTMAGSTLVFAGTAGTTSPRQINISIPGAEAGKTFKVSSSLGMTMICTKGTTAADIYTDSLVSGSGELTLTKLSSTEAEGTFTFTGANSSGLALTVSEGKFRVVIR